MNNYGVFSKHLLERHKLIQQAKLRRKVTEDEQLNIIITQDCLTDDNGVFKCSSDPENHIDKDIMYCIATKPEIRNVLHWINNNIVSKIIDYSYSTIYVKIRIATSMLNKLVDANVISKQDNMYIHFNMVRNLLDLKRDTIDDDLPF